MGENSTRPLRKLVSIVFTVGTVCFFTCFLFLICYHAVFFVFGQSYSGPFVFLVSYFLGWAPASGGWRLGGCLVAPHYDVF